MGFAALSTPCELAEGLVEFDAGHVSDLASILELLVAKAVQEGLRNAEDVGIPNPERSARPSMASLRFGCASRSSQ